MLIHMIRLAVAGIEMNLDSLYTDPRAVPFPLKSKECAPRVG